MNFFDKKKIPIAVIAFIGLVCTILMLNGRLVAEEKDRSVACAIEYESIVSLSLKSGQEPSLWLNALKEEGLHYLIVTDENEAEALSLAKRCGVKTGRSGGAAKEGDSFLMPAVKDGLVIAADQSAGNPSVPLVLVENTTRTSMVMPVDRALEEIEAPLVKGFYMYPDYNDSYDPTIHPCESENIMFRAALERGMRLIIMTPIYQGDEMVAEMRVYADILEGLSDRLGVRGITFGEDFSALPAPVLNPWLLAGSLLLAAALFTLLLSLLFPLSYKLEWLFLALFSVIAFGSAVLIPALAQKWGAFMGAVVFSCFASLALLKFAGVKKSFDKGGHVFLHAFFLLIVLLFAGISGGLYVSALLGTRNYMMGVSIFSGVKLSQLIPIGFSFILLCRILLTQKRADRTSLSLKNLWPQCLPVLCLAGVLFVLILRSGDTALPIAELEKRGRDWLEQTLYARPRTKEMLVAFPAVGMFVFACKKKKSLWQLLFGTIVSIGPVSVVNTFCHIVAPVRVSLIRTLLGGGIGLCFAVILLGALTILFLNKKPSDQV